MTSRKPEQTPGKETSVVSNGRCRHCNVDVSGSRKRCPLCGASLVGENLEGKETFPFIPTVYRRHNLLFKLLIFASAVAVIVSAAVNILVDMSNPWAVFVIVSVICVWTSLFLAIKKRKNVPKGMLYQVVFISIISVLWDAATGWHKWSLDFVIPILCVSVMVSLPLLSLILNWGIDNIITYFIISVFFGIVPIIFYFTGLLTVALPSIICVTTSFISIAALLVFKGDSMLSLLRRRMDM